MISFIINRKILILFFICLILSCQHPTDINIIRNVPIKIAIEKPLSTINCGSNESIENDTSTICDFQVWGNSEGINPDGKVKIYILVQFSDTTSFIIQYPSAQIFDDGTWTAEAIIGDSANPAFHGQEFNILAIADSNETLEHKTVVKSEEISDYPKSQTVGLVVSRKSFLEIISPVSIVKNEIKPDTSNELSFTVQGTSGGLARNSQYRIYVLVSTNSEPIEKWILSYPDGDDPVYSFNRDSCIWTAGARLCYEEEQPVLDRDSLKIIAIASHKPDLIKQIGNRPIADLDDELPRHHFIRSNVACLTVSRSSILEITSQSPLTACEPDTNLTSCFDIEGKTNGLILNSHFKIYACIWQSKWYPFLAYSFDRITKDWKAKIETKKEVFDEDNLKIVAVATLVELEESYFDLDDIPSYSITQEMTATLKRKLVKRIYIGDSPYGIAIIPNHGEAYVTQVGQTDITIIDIYDNEVIGKIEQVGTDLRGISVSLDGLKAYVCDYSEEYIKVINTFNPTDIKQIRAGRNCQNIALTYDQKFAFVIKDDNNKNVSLIDCINKVVMADTTVSAIPNNVAIVPFTYKTYVTINNGNIVVFNDAPNSLNYEMINVEYGSELNGIAIAPDGEKIYACLSSMSAGKVAVIDVANTSLDSFINVGGNPQGIAISPDGLTALVVNTVSKSNTYNNKISAIDLIRNVVIDTIKVENQGAFPQNIAIRSDGKYAYIINKESENITVIRMDLLGK